MTNVLNKTTAIVGAILALLVGAAFPQNFQTASTGVQLANAVPGDLLGEIDQPDCISGIGVAFNGTNILYTCNFPGDAFIHVTDLASTPLPAVAVADGGGDPVCADAIAWDSNENVLWGGTLANAAGDTCIEFDPVECQIWSIDMTTGLATLRFSYQDGDYGGTVAGCSSGAFAVYDGLTVDTVTDTLYHSPDVQKYIQHTDKTGVALPGSPIDFETLTSGPDLCPGTEPFPDLDPATDGCNNSGLAIGIDGTLFAGTNGEGLIMTLDPVAEVLLGQFASVEGRDEDMECGPVVEGFETILSRDLFTNIDILEVPEGTCIRPETVTADKFYTFTNNNWDPRCAEFDLTTGECIEFRLANINLDSDIFADLLPVNEDGKFVLQGQELKKKTVINPGQYIAVTEVTVASEQDITVVEDFSDCLDIGTVNPNKVPGGVQVVLIDSGGDVHDISGDLAAGIGGSIVLDPDNATVSVEDVPAGSILRVMVKFQPNDDLGMIGLECTNVETVLGEGGEELAEASADLIVVQK